MWVVWQQYLSCDLSGTDHNRNVWTFNQWRTVTSNIYTIHFVEIIHCQILTLYHSLGTLWHLSRTLSWVYEMKFMLLFLKVEKLQFFFLNTSCCKTFNGLSYRKYIFNKLLPFFHWSEYADLWSQHYLRCLWKLLNIACVHVCILCSILHIINLLPVTLCMYHLIRKLNKIFQSVLSFFTDN